MPRGSPTTLVYPPSQRLFLYEQAHSNLEILLMDVPIDQCPPSVGKIRVDSSNVVYARSKISGLGGMFMRGSGWFLHGVVALHVMTAFSLDKMRMRKEVTCGKGSAIL
ncbi:hypothetical protein H2248_008573 [Termitomyces sp. 'cryptogamus']|nr:hypothetical protein H2248_008573 [Termitomyces sp. 'cryptogamus']